VAKIELCSKCKFEKESEYECRCSRCLTITEHDGFVPQTNADRIRNMTDEELAKILFGSCLEEMGRTHCNLFHTDGCEKCVLAWLKSEVKE